MKHQCALSIFSFPVSPRMSLVVACQPRTLVKSFFSLSFSTSSSAWCFFFVSLSGTLILWDVRLVFLLVCSLFCISCGLDVSAKASMGSGQTCCDAVYSPTCSTSGGAWATCSVRLGLLNTDAPPPHPHTPKAFVLPVWVSILQRWSQYQRHQHPLVT